MELHKISRRSFLEATALSGAAAVFSHPLSGGLVSTASAAEAPIAAAAEEETKIVKTCCRACIHNCGVQNSEHSGIHTFHVGKRSKVRYVEPQGTYIAWLDFSPLGIGDPANYFFKKANVALTDGRECGEVGRGCVRMNFAMPYPLLEECFDRMAAALEADGLL